MVSCVALVARLRGCVDRVRAFAGSSTCSASLGLALAYVIGPLQVLLYYLPVACMLVALCHTHGRGNTVDRERRILHHIPSPIGLLT